MNYSIAKLQVCCIFVLNFSIGNLLKMYHTSNKIPLYFFFTIYTDGGLPLYIAPGLVDPLPLLHKPLYV